MDKPLEELSFENAIAELEALVSKMETGRLSLDELVSGFERGRKLAGFCRSQLDQFERKITLLSKDDGNEGVWQDFAPESASAMENSRSVSVSQDDVPF